jgi:hypothetical protein
MEGKTLSVTFCLPIFLMPLKQESETGEHSEVIYPFVIFTTSFPKEHLR